MASLNHIPDPEDPEIAAQATLQGMRSQLTRRINAHAHPSRLINQIAFAELRCVEVIKVLGRLIARAPKVLWVIRDELRKEFEIDPDTLLFTVPKPPAEPQKVDSLTDRTLLSLALPAVPINLNQFTALSVKGDPTRQLPYTPLQVLQRVIAMKLQDRIAWSATPYWDALQPGSSQTRRGYWAELHAELFADRAFMAQQLDELSSAGMALLQALIDAPSAGARQRAGGDWATVRASSLMWPGTPAVAIPGALHIYREGDPDGAPHVIYLPGVVRNFYEYPSFFDLQCGLVKLASESLFDELWQCLPLERRHELCRPTDLTPALSVDRGSTISGDALAMSAQALLEGQWENELACALAINHAHVFSPKKPRPQPLTAVPFLRFIERARKQLVGKVRLGTLLYQLLKWDEQRRRAEIIFASTAPGLALLTAEQQVKRYEKGLLALFNADDLSVETAALEEFVVLESQLKAHKEALNSLINGAQQRLYDMPFWIERPTGAHKRYALFLRAHVEALRCEVQLQHRLKLIPTAHQDLVMEVVERLSTSKYVGGKAQVFSVSVGSVQAAFYPLHNVWVVARATAMKLPSRGVPVALYAFGQYGGLKAFSGLDALTRGLKASLGSSDDSVLWGCIEHDKRHDLRDHARRETLTVRYEPIEGNPATVSFKHLMAYYFRLNKRIEGTAGLFNEVKDAELSRLLLLAELDAHLKIPDSPALNQAQANIDLLRKAALEAKKLPQWLAGATPAQLKHFKRLQRRYLSSAFASESLLERALSDLETFARRKLIARLTEDGFYPELDIDKPLITMPDDVRGSFCGNQSHCTPGDRGQVLTPSTQTTTFSMLQLALHNLDPQAPWVPWRLNRARYLQPQWKQRLNKEYLIKTVSSLDIGGNYDTQINHTFYPTVKAKPSLDASRIPALINRTLDECAHMQLFSAVQQGLSTFAQSLFSTAMAARTPEDLLKNGYDLKLYVVHLAAHTMQHDRYISGVVVMQDQGSGRCVVYWPAAPHALIITEYISVAMARVELSRVAASADLVKLLARQVAPGWAFDAIIHDADEAGEPGWLSVMPDAYYFEGKWRLPGFIRSFSITHLQPTPVLDEIEKLIREQIASNPSNWLAIVPISHSEPRALLYYANVLDLQRRTQAASNSGKVLDEYRVRRLAEQTDSSLRALISFFFPLFALANSFYELLIVARRFHRFADPSDVVDIVFMTQYLVFDLWQTFTPGPKIRGVAAGIVRRPLGAVLNRIHRSHFSRGRVLRQAAPSAAALKPLDRFKVKGVPPDAVALKGRGREGVYVKDGQQFVTDDTHHYPVYQRDSESAFRLRNMLKSGEDELVLNIHQPKEWLLEADNPQPGPSSGVHDPWRAPRAPSSDWQPPRERMATENRIVQSRTTDTQWLSWRAQVHPRDIVGFPAPGVFEVGSAPRGSSLNARFLRVAPPYTDFQDPNSGFYRMLPQGDHASLTDLVFITRNEPPGPSARADIMRWTSTDIRDQPIPVSRLPTGEWQHHSALFDSSLEHSVGRAFPSMTNEARKFTVMRMIELADPSHSATASHLLGIRATLDEWLPPLPARSGQTDDLLRMLRINERRKQYLYVGFEGKAPGFTRVDFTPPHPLDPSLQYGVVPVRTQRLEAERAAVRTVLEQQGYRVEDLSVRRAGMRFGEPSIESVVTHPRSNTIYYVAYQWLELGRMTVRGKLSNRWVRIAINSHPDSLLLRAVDTAMQEQRLVRIVAGIQWPTKGRLDPTVYFVKLTP
ncbi:DUF6543 domain-containing protein [Pseudomonas sp. W2Aug9]|uniref:dermonecrotic toxin domain-containing protein n=1 Tax=Pseudomonas sp. W2Aug9 TaxID=1215242 RepID=UPI00200566A2|nr:DUF6543 domain-containing protein [Pseudomonas sp. W2Aug9]MCK3827939.1 hypothetical protein [Pseudomonas sp. W2Aug9]